MSEFYQDKIDRLEREISHLNESLGNHITLKNQANEEVMRCHEKIASLTFSTRVGMNRQICPNCQERKNPCACMKNKCLRCGAPVGNITFTYCDKCWDKKESSNEQKIS